jgi:predicted ABC-type ATPase
MLEEIMHLAERGANFGFETTLSGRTHLNLVSRLKKRRYVVHFFYLWAPSVEIALSRVRERVSGGGHDIPEPIVRRRFERSIDNFVCHYRKLADSWILFNNSTKYPTTIAFDKESELHKIDAELFDRIVAKYGKK